MSSRTDIPKHVADELARRGEKVAFENPMGDMVEISTLPRPVQKELPVWLTTAGNPESYRAAGKMGVNVLTHLLGQSLDELAEKIKIYREATGAGLKEAKEAIEDITASLREAHPDKFPAPKAGCSPVILLGVIGLGVAGSGWFFLPGAQIW